MNGLLLVDSQSMVRLPLEVLGIATLVQKGGGRGLSPISMVVVYEYLLDLCVNALRID